MAWSKIKTTIVIGAAFLLAAGTTTVAVKEMSHRHEDSVFDRFYTSRGISTEMLNSVPPTVIIRSVKGPEINKCSLEGNGRYLGLGQPMKEVVAMAYGFGRYRVISDVPLPEGNFDYIATLQKNNDRALQEEIRKKYGLVTRREARDVNVFVMTVQNRHAPNFQVSPAQSTMEWSNGKTIRATGIPAEDLMSIMEDGVKAPVIDQSGLMEKYDLKFVRPAPGQGDDENRELFRQAILDQLGLQLTPAVQPLEVLVIQKAH